MADGSTDRPSTDEIYRRLRDEICLLDLPPGSRLTESALAERFGVSRTPIRKVLDRLEFDRLVEQRSRAGSIVTVVDAREIRDVWAVRLKIAELIGDFVRLPAPPAVVDELQKVTSRLPEVRTTRDVRLLGRLYNDGHEQLLEIIDNATLRRIHDQLYHQTARVWLQFLPEMDLDTEIDIMAQEIRETIEAIQGSDGAHLSRVRSRHMRGLLDRFNRHVARPIG